MKRILQIVGCMELGGTEAFIMNNYRILDRTQYQFDFVIFHEKFYPYLMEIKSLGGRYFFTGAPAIGNIRKFYKEIKRVILDNGPYTAIHSHVNIDNGIPLMAAYSCGIPIRISHSHATAGKDVSGFKKIWYLYKERLIKKYATDLLACSNAAGEYLYGNKLFKKHGILMPNGIDIRLFLESKEKEKINLMSMWSINPECSLIIGNFSRFEQNKNSLFIIRIFSSILEIVPNAMLIMGGDDGGELEKCRDLAKKLKILDNIRFVGSRSDIPVCLKLIDIFLFPSICEGLGIVFLEAQASKCFCVASEGVPNEADIGLGSAIFIDLRKNEEEWAKRIIDEYSVWNKPGDKLIMKKFKESGFEIHEAHERLMSIYDKK